MRLSAGSGLSVAYGMDLPFAVKHRNIPTPGAFIAIETDIAIMLAPESILAWIVIGAIAGWLAGLLVKGYGFGLFGNIIVGILGAGIAGLLAPRLGLYTELTGGNIVAALLGALILLFIVGLVRRA